MHLPGRVFSCSCRYEHQVLVREGGSFDPENGMTRALILGGGVAGLAAAFRLLELQPKWEVAVLEKAEVPGGLAASWHLGPFAADLGPHRIYTELAEIERLLPELIARDRGLTVQRRSELLLRGHFYRYPVRAGELLRHMGPLRVARLGFSALSARLGARSVQPDNYAEAMCAAFGRETYRMLIEPYSRKVWKAEPETLSHKIARVRVSAGNADQVARGMFGRSGQKASPAALSEFSYIRGGIDQLTASLVRRAEERGGTIATGMNACGFEWDGRRLKAALIRRDDMADDSSVAGGNSEHMAAADWFISTIPITDLVDYLQPLSASVDAARQSEELEFLGMVLVGLVIRRPRLTPNCWLYFPEEHLVFNRAYEPRNFDSSLAPDDRTMVVFEVTARWNDKLWQSSDDEIIDRVRADVLKTGLLNASEIEDAAARRITHAYPLYMKGFSGRLAAVYDYLRGFPNLVTTGRQGLFNHNNMDHSMLMGIRAAECVAGGGDVAAAWYGNLSQFAGFRIVD
jgi:protoporphyrinogen oxidase